MATFTVRGKNIEITPSLREYVEKRVGKVTTRDCYWVLGWGRLPSEKTVVRENNFPRASISFYRTETRKDVQLFLQKSGYSDVPDDAGFSFLARDRHLQVKDNRGQIIYDGDILLKPGSKNVVFDRVKKMRPLSSMKWKRIVVHYICVFCQRGGIYISLLSAMIAIISVLYVFFHNTARRKISDLFCRNHVGGWVHVFLHDHLFQCFDAMPSLSCLFHANDGHAVFCQSGFYSRWTFDLVSGRWSCKKRKRIRLFRDNSGREVDQREHEK